MKKIGIAAFILILAILIGILVIRVKEIDTDVTKNKTKVGMILNGEKSDRSWSQSHYDAMEKIADKLNLDIEYYENVPEEKSEEIFEQLADDGSRIIIANSYGYGESSLRAAARYPDIHFYQAAGIEQASNLATYFGRIYQIRYLCGIVAGMQTETDEIGYVAAFPISEVNRGINAFTLGVRSVNPDASVYVQWSNSWAEDEYTKNAAVKLFENHHNIDVIAMHTDSLKVLEEADKRGIWAIGYNMDNGSLFPDVWLTAAVWEWEKFYEPRILECLQGKFQGKNYWEGIKSGVVKLAPLSPNVKPEVRQVIEEEKKKFEDGTFDVFYGPIRDTDGNIRIGEGESMTDEAMLNEFDWYVEGVSCGE